MIALVDENDELKRQLENQREEIARLKELVSQLVGEAEVRAREHQEKYDEMFARTLEATLTFKAELDRIRKEMKAISDDRAEYESIIRRNRGATISEVERALPKLYEQCQRASDRFGWNSSELHKEVNILRKHLETYHIVVLRHPDLDRYVKCYPDPDRVRPSTSTPTEADRREDLQRLGHRRSALVPRGRGGTAGASSSRALSRGGRGWSIDAIMNADSEDFVTKWLSFCPSHRPPQ